MALIGSIAINMSVATQKLVAGLKTAGDKMRDFGGKAALLGAQTLAAIVSPMETMKAFALMGAKAAAAMVDPMRAMGRAMATAATGARISAMALGRLAAAMGRMGLAAAGMALKGVVGGLKMMGHAIGATARAAYRGINALGKYALVAGGIAAAGLYKAARSASDLAEQTNRAKILFGDNADYITEKARVMGDAFGVSQSQFVGAASEMGGMLKGMGYTAADASKLGSHFTQLAMDVASATQTSLQEAMERMRSGLAGEAEAVRKWGVDLTEANLKIEAVRRGIAKTGVELTQTQKIQTRSIIMDEKLAYAKGDMAKTADQAENAAKGLMGRLENLAATIGNVLLPIVGPALSGLQVGVEALGLAFGDMTKGIISDQPRIGDAIAGTTKSMGLFQQSIGFIADSWQSLKYGFLVAYSYIESGLSKLVGWLAKIGDAFDAVISKIGGVKTGVGDALRDYSAAAAKAGEDLGAMAQAEAMKAPASEGINKLFDRARDKIKAARTEAAGPGVTPSQFKPTSVETPKATMPKFASAMEAGSKEAASTILRLRFGGGPAAGGPEMQTAKNTAVTNQHLSRLVNILSNPAGAAGAGLGNLLAVNI